MLSQKFFWKQHCKNSMTYQNAHSHAEYFRISVYIFMEVCLNPILYLCMIYATIWSFFLVNCWLIFTPSSHMQGFIQAILMPVIWHKKINLTIEYWNSIFTYMFFIIIIIIIIIFASLQSYWNSFAVVFLAIKVKRHLHVSYMLLFNYLRIHNILAYTI